MEIDNYAPHITDPDQPGPVMTHKQADRAAAKAAAARAPSVKGYTVRADEAPAYGGKPTWYARVRHKSWKPGDWVVVASNYGRICYASRSAARAGGRVWATRNEGFRI